MKDLTRRVKNIEEKAGLSDRKSYMFIHICHPESILSDAELKGKGFYEKDDFKGLVMVIEECGKENRGIDSSSEEGRKILIEHGYQKID